MLEHLDIQNFRKFDRYRLEFGQRNLLVGPNNAGKSTIIEALRLVAIVINRLGNLNPEQAPDWVPERLRRGYFPSLRGLDFTLGRETFHQYSEPPARISARLASGSRVHVFVGPDGEVFATADAPDGAPVSTKGEARMLGLDRIGIQPQVGPVAAFERELDDRYVRGALDSSLAPTHFRNQLRLLDKYFDDFKRAAESSWPGLTLDRVEGVGLGKERHLAVFLRDGDFVAELGAMGHGLQMWLQLMWFLTRAADDATIVLDEPDVYMHPDLQRRLIRILFQRRQQVIVATHSIEMMAEVEPDELIAIDASARKARSARKVADVQRVVDQLGGVHNIEFARLARAERCLVSPRYGGRILSRWYDLVLPGEHGALDLLPSFPCESWSEWPYVVASKRAIDRLRDEPIQMICLFPGGPAPASVFETVRAQADREGIDLYVWKRRELENYALDPYVVTALLVERAADVTPGLVASQLEAIAASLHHNAQMYLNSLAEAIGVHNDADRWLAESWDSPVAQLSAISGRLAILRLSTWANERYGAKIGLRDLVAAVGVDDLHPEVAAVLSAVASGGHVATAVPNAEARPWPTTAPLRQDAASPGVSDVLGLFEAAGIFE